ncbi:MAG: class II glutamine amidotransferase [Hyphomicrobiales bacterium]|nr:class II glutamine amidotransferase [Hyphomicrobiales bacterium]
MCELFAMSSRIPTTISLSMRTLASRGAVGSHLADGWGVAFYEGNDVRVLREPEPAADSDWLAFANARGVRSHIAIAHIRHATQGEISLANTQPFARELGGRLHCFAHNGMLPGVEGRLADTGHRFRPIGSTDSEAAFCILLERLAPLWADGAPDAAERTSAVSDFAADMRKIGPANFVYSDGDLLIAHGHRRTQANGVIEPPGLTMLTRRCAIDRDALPHTGVAIEQTGQDLTLFASVPLTDEPWLPLREGEIVVVREGAPASPTDRDTSHPAPIAAGV